MRDVIQATLLGSLLFLDRADLLREWQQSGGAAAAMAAVAAAGPDQTAGEEGIWGDLRSTQAHRSTTVASCNVCSTPCTPCAPLTPCTPLPGGCPPVAVCPAGPMLPALCDPHPGLQLLLAVDVPATITVLAEATAGWDAVDTDLRAAAGKPTAEQESVLVATQVRVSAGWCCVMVMGRAQAEAVQHGQVVCLCAGCGAGAARRQRG